MRPLVLVPVVLVDPTKYQNLLNSHNSAVSGYYQVIQERDAIQRALLERDQLISQLAFNPNHSDQHGQYPLHQACAYGDS